MINFIILTLICIYQGFLLKRNLKSLKQKIVSWWKVNKLLGEVTLENQAFVKEPGVTVANYLGRHSGAKALTYYRFQVGEGIEKEVVDFAAQVAADNK